MADVVAEDAPAAVDTAPAGVQNNQWNIRAMNDLSSDAEQRKKIRTLPRSVPSMRERQ
jgi:hypothetical protein